MNKRGRRAIGLVEVIVGLALVSFLVCTVVWIMGYGGRSTSRTSAQMSLQQASRKMLVRLLREIREGMEVIAPLPGTTLTYALVRDKVSLVLWYYQIPQAGQKDRFELWRYVHDPKKPAEKRRELMLQNVKRLTFTSRSEGALQVNLTLAEDEREYSILTTVRLHSIASSEELW